MGSDHDCIQRAHIGQEACNQTARLLGAQLQVSAFLAQIVKLYLQELNLHPDSNGGMRRSKCIHMSCRSAQNYVTHGQACRRSQKVLPSWEYSAIAVTRVGFRARLCVRVGGCNAWVAQFE